MGHKVIISSIAALASIAAWLLYCDRMTPPVPVPLPFKSSPRTAMPTLKTPTAPEATGAMLPVPTTCAPPHNSRRTTETPIATTYADTDAVRSLDYFRDTRTPVEQRIATLAELGRRSDAATRDLLMAVGDAPLYVNRYAVEALGAHHGAPARAYLERKTADADALVVCAAIRALGKWGADAIPAFEKALTGNHERHDGHQTLVCREIVTMLGLTASPAAAPALIRELARADSLDWDLGYGSTVIAAIGHIDSANARKAAGSYADLLAGRLPSDPMARRYVEDRIAEARAVARPHTP